MLHAARLKYRMQKVARKFASGHHRTTLSGYIFATKAGIDNRKKLVKQKYLLHMSSQYGELWPTRGWDHFVSLGHPSKFQQVSRLGFITAVTSLNEANQTWHNVWPSPGLVRYIYTFGISCPLTEFCHVQNSLCVRLCTIAQVSRAISSQLRHLSTIGKKLTKQ